MRAVPVRLLIVALVLAAAALVALAIAVTREPLQIDRHRATLAGLLFGLLLLARLFPVPLAPKVKIRVGTAPMFAAALLLPTPVAMVVAAVAALASDAREGAPWAQTLFFTAESARRIAAGATVFDLVANTDYLMDLAPGRWLVAVPLAAATMYLVNEVVVDLGVSVLTRRRPLRDFWRQRKFHLPHEGALFLLGLFVAAIAVRYPWAVALLAVPSYVVHRSLRDGVALREQTREALEELADVVDMRDHYTFEHSRRVAVLARATAAALGLPADEVETIAMAGRVHDVGKIGIKSTVLMKPETLTDPQWTEMRLHPEIGARLVAKFPQFARGREIVLSHHERYDGKGYPRGLAGDRIPLGGRILAVADAWDAMTSHRAYRQALESERVYTELERGRGTQFDPVVLDAFLRALAAHPELAVYHTREAQDVDVPMPHPSMA